MDIENKINLVKDLIIFIQSKDTEQNEDDIRSISTYSFYQISESFLISLILSKHISDVEYCKSQINPNITELDISILEYAFDGFIKDSFFIKIFVLIENQIRQIAEFYETPSNKINTNSILTTFKNVIEIGLFSSINHKERELFEFYCNLRNTMHNFGFQTKSNKTLVIKDSNSVIEKNEIIIGLTLNSPNKITFQKLILLKEQVFKLLSKINNLIPKDDFIKHRLVSSKFNL